MGKLDDSEYGQLDFNNGELHASAHLSDPVAYRGNKKAADVGAGSTAIMFIGADIRRSDNVKECVAMMIGRADDRYPIGHEGTAAAGEWEWFVRRPHLGSTDAAMVRQMREDFPFARRGRSEEHTSELQSQSNLVCRLLLEKKKKKKKNKNKRNKNKMKINIYLNKI